MSVARESTSGAAQVGGASLYYETAGSGPAVLWIHAGVADSRMWDGTSEALADRFRCVRFDIRGFGRSVIPPGRFSYHGDAVAVLDAVGVERASLVGCSFGGQIAIDTCLAYPHRVRSLVLVAAGIGGREPSEAMARFGEEEEALLERRDLDGATELNLRFWVDGPHRSPDQVDPLLRERVRIMQRALFDQEIPRGVERVGLEPPAIGRLGEIRVPVLIVIGDGDQPDVVDTADRLTMEIPGASKVVFPDVAHMVSMEAPARFRDVVAEFLERVP